MSEVKINWNKQLFLKILEVLALTAVVCLTISEFGGYYLIITTIGKHSRLLRKIALLLFGVKVILTRYNKRESVLVLLMSLLGYLNYSNSGNIEMLMSIAMILSLKNIPLKKVFYVCFCTILGMVILLGTLSIAGITGVLKETMNYGRGAMETRYYFGFYHPNQWAHAIFMLLAFWCVTFWERIDWKALLVMTSINFAVYKLAASRTAVICGIVLLFMTLAYKYAPKLMGNKKVNYVIAVSGTIVWAFSVFLVSNAAGDLWQKFDRIFNGRLRMGKEYLLSYSPTIWGERIADQLENGYVLDFGYLRFLLENGILIYILMILAILLLCVCAIKKEKYEILVMVASISLYGIYENIAMAMTPENIIMLFFAMLCFDQNFYSAVNQRVID